MWVVSCRAYRFSFADLAIPYSSSVDDCKDSKADPLYPKLTMADGNADPFNRTTFASEPKGAYDKEDRTATPISVFATAHHAAMWVVSGNRAELTGSALLTLLFHIFE